MADLKNIKEPYKFSPSVEAEVKAMREISDANRLKRNQNLSKKYEERKIQAREAPDQVDKGLTEEKTLFKKPSVDTMVIIAVLVVLAILIYSYYRHNRTRPHPTFMRVSKPTVKHKTFQEEMGAENE